MTDEDSDSGTNVKGKKSEWRTLEYSFTLNVVTSVSCKASVRSLNAEPPSVAQQMAGRQEPSYLLSLATTNRGPKSVHVDSFHFVSRSWNCSHLAHVQATAPNPRLNRDVIEPGCESVFHLFLAPSHKSDTDTAVESSDDVESKSATDSHKATAEVVPVYDRSLDEEKLHHITVSSLHALNNDGS